MYVNQKSSKYKSQLSELARTLFPDESTND